jgi:tetratricopeptide (TPR) repeat protein
VSTDKIESLILAVEQAINEEDFEKIIDGCTSIIALDPKNADAYANRASAYAAREDFASALKDHDQSVLLYPDSVTYSNRARSHFESGHPKLKQ